MSRDATDRAPSLHATAARRPWRAPTLEALPPLEDLTLQSPIWGGEDGFSFLDVAGPTHRLG